ncbi:MAG: energy-coupling factor transporter transmembrane component T [Anaerolineae bacterium]
MMMRLGLDPRARTIMALSWAAAATVARGVPMIAASIIPLLAITVAAGQSRALLRWLRLIGVTIVSWFVISWIAFSWAAAIEASLRLLALALTFFVLFRTTSPEDLGGAWQQAGLPFSLAFVLTTSMQYVAVMESRARQIIDAQRARGIPLEPGWQAVRHYAALFIPLLVQAFQAADHLAEAMEARGFGRTPRTQLREYRWRGRDSIAILITLAAAGAFFIGWT